MRTRRDISEELDVFQRAVRALVDKQDVDPHELSVAMPTELLLEVEQFASEFGALAFHLHARCRQISRALERAGIPNQLGRAKHRRPDGAK